ncbi:hypothetical protein TNCV_3444681 [Trichonephila clavipes]|nr:hypothetical protein TNCV_3444681 [Trichonephila clavipes]
MYKDEALTLVINSYLKFVALFSGNSSIFCIIKAKIGGAMAYTQMDEDSIPIITNLFYDFQKFMSKSATTLFSESDYIPATIKCKKEVS